jgi:hypothetical protein
LTPESGPIRAAINSKPESAVIARPGTAAATDNSIQIIGGAGSRGHFQ